MCLATTVDGYQITLNGNIIANQGFINKIGFPKSAGKYTLDAQYTALWERCSRLGNRSGWSCAIRCRIGSGGSMCSICSGLSCLARVPDLQALSDARADL